MPNTRKEKAGSDERVVAPLLLSRIWLILRFKTLLEYRFLERPATRAWAAADLLASGF